MTARISEICDAMMAEAAIRDATTEETLAACANSAASLICIIERDKDSRMRRLAAVQERIALGVRLLDEAGR